MVDEVTDETSEAAAHPSTGLRRFAQLPRRRHALSFAAGAVVLTTVLAAAIGIPVATAAHERDVASETHRAALAAETARATSELAAVRTEAAFFLLPLSAFEATITGVVDPTLVSELKVAQTTLALSVRGTFPRAIAEARSVVVRRLGAIAEAEASAADTAVGVQTAADQGSRDAVTAAAIALRTAANAHGDVPTAFSAVVAATAALTASQDAAVAARAAEAARAAAATAAARNSGGTGRTGSTGTSGGSGSTGGSASDSSAPLLKVTVPVPDLWEPTMPTIINNANHRSQCGSDVVDEMTVASDSTQTFDYDFPYSYLFLIVDQHHWHITIYSCA
jgi:hypothetical protein